MTPILDKYLQTSFIPLLMVCSLSKGGMIRRRVYISAVRISKGVISRHGAEALL